MGTLGFRRSDSRIGVDPHAHYFNPRMQISIRPARVKQSHEPYSPGLHHVCLQAADRDSLDEAESALRALGVEVTSAKEYPEYHDDYYAIYFKDPDGIRFEIVARSRYREMVERRWTEFTEFLNPLTKLLLESERK